MANIILAEIQNCIKNGVAIRIHTSTSATIAIQIQGATSVDVARILRLIGGGTSSIEVATGCGFRQIWPVRD